MYSLSIFTTAIRSLSYPDGRVYTGPCSEAPHGDGKMTYADGKVYEGHFEYGVRSGRGKSTKPDGTTYEGNWKNDKINGHCVLTWSTTGVYAGYVYVGDFVEDQRSGHGRMIYPDGGVYIGEWLNDKQNGQGVDISTSGRVLTGQWKDNRYMGDVSCIIS